MQKEGFIHVCDQITYEVSPASSKFLPEAKAVELMNMESNLEDNCQTDPYEKSKPEVFLEDVRDHFGLNFVNNEEESVDSDSQTEE